VINKQASSTRATDNGNSHDQEHGPARAQATEKANKEQPKKPDKKPKENGSANAQAAPKQAKKQAAKKETAAADSTAASQAEEPGAAQTALVIDDEPANRDFLVRLLEQAGLTVYGASSAGEALKITQQHDTLDLVAIDNKLPDMDGVELLVNLRQRYPKARMVMATMLDERALMEQAFENGCDVFLVKPHGFMELFRRLQMAQAGNDTLQKMIIDQYGPRPYRG
jgi:CheY-like chemotaxis protein